MKNLIFILLFVSSILSGQVDRFPFYTLPPAAAPDTGTGESILLYYEDFDARAADASLTQAEMLAIFGSCTDPTDGGDAVFNVNGDGNERIFDDGGGDMVLLAYFDYPCTGSPCGMQVFKDMEADWGADPSLDGHTDLWMSWNTYYEAAWDESSSSKTWGGFIVGEWIWFYEHKTLNNGYQKVYHTTWHFNI